MILRVTQSAQGSASARGPDLQGRPSTRYGKARGG